MDHEQSGSSDPHHSAGSPEDAGFFQKAADTNRRFTSAAPLFPMALGIITGIVTAERLSWGPAAFLLLLVIASAMAFSAEVRRYAGILLVLMAGTGVGGLLHWNREQVIPSTNIAHLLRTGEDIVRLRGRIASEPSLPIADDGVFGPWQFKGEQTSFLLRVSEMEDADGWRKASGLIKVTIREAVLDFAEGDTIELFGRLIELAPPQNPGVFDWRSYYRQQGVVARMYCDQRENVVRISREGAGVAAWLRAKARGLLTNDIAASSAEEASLLEAMVLGHRSRFDRRLNEVFTRAGCVHFIAASGTNIVVLMGALWFAGRMIGLDKRRSAWLMIVAVVLYGVVAEARPPILRACVMGLMFCFALLLQRASSHMNWICAAAIILCLFNPLTVFDVGFQLSFAAVLGVAYLAPAIVNACVSFYWWGRHVPLRDPYARADRRLQKIAERFSPLDPRQRIQRSLGKLLRVAGMVCAVSMGAWLISLPITALWFQRAQPWGALGSVLIYPPMSMVMIFGIVKVGLAAISPALAAAVTFILGVVDFVMIRIVERIAALPAASPSISPPPWWFVAAYYLFLLTFVLTFRSRRQDPETADGKTAAIAHSNHRATPALWTVVALFILAVCGSAWHFDERSGPRLTVTVLSVGAGSAVVMELPDGETILYDAGSLGVAGVGRNVIAPFLRHRGVQRIDRLYVSHPNLDHFSGIPELLAEMPVGPIVWNHCFERLSPPRSPARKLTSHLKSADWETEVIAASQTSWEAGGVTFEKLWPLDDRCIGLSANDSSTVLKVTYAGRSILFTGDIAEIAERNLASSVNLRCDVLLLPHHGSVCASTEEFLNAVNADILVRSSNQRMADTNNGLRELIGDAAVYNTADHGAVTIVIDEHGLQMKPWLTGDSH